ncbi:MAG TPA: class I SAM-dependent methyltransferase [Actinomycetota bacterium]
MSDHVARNRAAWAGYAADYVANAVESWSRDEPKWGVFGVEDERIFPADVAGKDVVELGCGTAYVSSWFARRGARVIGLDLTTEQLATARAMCERFALPVPLVQADAERAPFPDASFDIAFSEYGASLWCDPYAWIPEAARLLRPGGELTFMTNSVWISVCIPDTDAEGPATDRMRRPYFGMHRTEWPDETGVEFHLGHGDWIRLLRANGFDVLDLIEIQSPPDATTSYPWVTGEWASKWPVEEVWKARKR